MMSQRYLLILPCDTIVKYTAFLRKMQLSTRMTEYALSEIEYSYRHIESYVSRVTPVMIGFLIELS